MAIFKFKEICDKIGSGSTPQGGKEAYYNHGVSLIRSQNVLDFTLSRDGLAYIDLNQAEKLNSVEVQENDVLLNITGDSVARVSLMDSSYLPARVNQHVAIIRGNKKLVLNSYIMYFLQWRKKQLLQLSASGATRKALTKGMIERLEIDLPTLDKQKRIVSILNSLQERIKINHQLNDNLAV